MLETDIGILGDQPMHTPTFFNFESYSEALKEIIVSKETPLVIGIFGDWGSGKTTLMKILEQKIKKDGESSSTHTIWFNVWMDEKEDTIRRALLMRIQEELKTGRARARGKYEIPDLEDFRLNFEKKKKAVIFIDDLNRCIPEKAIEVLEAIKPVLGVKGCIFVIAIDRSVISKGIRIKYRDFTSKGEELPTDGDEYLEKIIQFSFTLPSIPDDKLKDFINYYDPENSFKKYQEITIKGIGRNPGKIKRFINSIEFQKNLAEVIPEIKVIKEELKENFDALLIEWQIISSSSDKDFEEFSRQILKNNKLLLDMHIYLESETHGEPSEVLRPFLKEPIQGLIQAFPGKGKLTEEFIEKVIHFSTITSIKKIEIEEAEPRKPLTPGEVRKAIENRASLEGAILSNAHLESLDLTGMNLSKADLGGAILSNTNLTMANLSGANLAGADLTGADLTGINLSGANLSRFALSVVKKFEGASLPGLELSKTDFTGADLSLANFSGANLSGANLSSANLYRANLSKAKFSGANLSGTNLFEADLSDADLSNRDLSGADFTGAKLTRANLQDSKLLRVNLTDADLSGANLAGADLSNSRLLKANLTDADLSYASLNETQLLLAILNGANLSNATFIGAITPSVEVNEKTKAEHMRIVEGELKEEYLFNWDNIPGDDNGKLMEFLNRHFGIEWVKTAKIGKIDGRTIKVSTEKNSLSLGLNDERTKVNLKIDDGRTEEFIVKIEDNKLNIYQEDVIFKSKVKQALDNISGNLRKIICRDNDNLRYIYASLER